MRLFFAVCLPAVNKLADHLDVHRGLLVTAGYKVITRGNLHLTLNFVGDADPETALRMVALGAAVTVTPFSMELGGPLIGLPDPRNPRVLAYAVKTQTEALASLARWVGNARADRFLPHVTVARANSPKAQPHLPELPRVVVPVNSFCLMNSELRREGAVYSIVEEFLLR